MDEMISRSAAIEAIEKHIRTAEEPYQLTDADKVMNHAFEIAASCVYNLSAAEAEVRTQMPSEDCISRYGVSAWLANRGYRGLANKVMDEDRFPSVQPKSYREGYQAGFKDAKPERKRGKWIDYGQYADNFPHHCWQCSECNEGVIEIDTPWFKFCPNCGADMREVSE